MKVLLHPSLSSTGFRLLLCVYLCVFSAVVVVVDGSSRAGERWSRLPHGCVHGRNGERRARCAGRSQERRGTGGCRELLHRAWQEGVIPMSDHELLVQKK